jgi:hypothetical protein
LMVPSGFEGYFRALSRPAEAMTQPSPAGPGRAWLQVRARGLKGRHAPVVLSASSGAVGSGDRAASCSCAGPAPTKKGEHRALDIGRSLSHGSNPSPPTGCSSMNPRDARRRREPEPGRRLVREAVGRSPAHGVARKHEIRQCIGASTSPHPLPRTSVAVFRRSRAAPDGCAHGKGPDLRLPAIPPRAWRGSFASRSRVASRTRSTAALLLIREPPQSLARSDPAGRSLLAPPP